MSVVKKCFSTVEPKEPVPPVITKVLFLNASVILLVLLVLFMVLILPRLLFLLSNFSNRDRKYRECILFLSHNPHKCHNSLR